jgi:lysophospholipid acyltransferase (LPLAT)-like uncharacterized protein
VPNPFSRVTIEYLPPRWVARDATRDQMEGMADEIGRELRELEGRLGP